MHLVSQGHTAKTAARQLGIGHETVRDYIKTARLRLGAATTAQAAAMLAAKEQR